MGRPAVLKIDILADAKGVGKGVSDAEGKLGKLGAVGAKVGKAMAVGLAAGAVAVGAFAVASVGAASSVEQSFGAVESVFGKAAAQVKGYAGAAATELGLAKSEYASLAAVVGSQLQSMGQSQAESAVKSRELIGVGADLAATFGGSVSDAVSAVGSLLRGERDPIEKYGIAIKAADVQARLAAQGQDKLEGAARKTAEAQATLALLTEQSKNAHGAFGRESNTLAGQQERLRAQFENVKATVGAGLTPVLTALLTFVGTRLLPKAQELAATLRENLGPAFTKVAAWVRNPVLPTLSDLTDFLGRNSGAIKTLAVVLGTVGAALLVYSTTVKVVTAVTRTYAAVQGILNAVMRANPIGLVVTALIAVGAALVLAYKKSETFRSVVDGAFAAVKSAAGGVRDAIAAIVDKVQSAISAISRLAGAAKRVGGVVGKLNPFSAVPLVGYGPPLVGGYATGPALGPLTTAALGDSSLSLLARSPAAAGVVVVDRRSFPTTVNISGAVDPVGTARQLEQVLADQARRLGRAPTLTGAVG